MTAREQIRVELISIFAPYMRYDYREVKAGGNSLHCAVLYWVSRGWIHDEFRTEP